MATGTAEEKLQQQAEQETEAKSGIGDGIKTTLVKEAAEIKKSFKPGKSIAKAGKFLDKRYRRKRKSSKGKALIGLVAGSLKPAGYASVKIGSGNYSDIPLSKDIKGVPRVADVSYERVPITIGGIGEGQPAILLIPSGMSPITQTPEGKLAISSGQLSTPLAAVPVASPELMQPSNIVYVRPQTRQIRYVPIGSGINARNV